MGPGVVALLVSVVPVVHFLTLDAFTFLASAAALALIRRRRVAPPPPVRMVREPVWRGITRGYHATANHPLLRYYLSVSGVLNGAWFAVYYLCLPLMIATAGVEVSGQSGLGSYGLILSAYGCGNLAATVFLGGRTLPARPQFLMLAGNIQTGCGILLLAAANFLPLEWRLAGFAFAAALGAMGGPMQDIPTAVLRQTRIAASERAAAMRAYMAMVCLGVLVAMLLTPTVVGWIGVTGISSLVAPSTWRGGGGPDPVRRMAGRRRRATAEAASATFLMPSPAKRLLNLATWPPVSMMRCTPVHAGCDFGSMSRRSVSPSLP